MLLLKNEHSLSLKLFLLKLSLVYLKPVTREQTEQTTRKKYQWLGPSYSLLFFCCCCCKKGIISTVRNVDFLTGIGMIQIYVFWEDFFFSSKTTESHIKSSVFLTSLHVRSTSLVVPSKLMLHHEILFKRMKSL